MCTLFPVLFTVFYFGSPYQEACFNTIALSLSNAQLRYANQMFVVHWIFGRYGRFTHSNVLGRSAHRRFFSNWLIEACNQHCKFFSVCAKLIPQNFSGVIFFSVSFTFFAHNSFGVDGLQNATIFRFIIEYVCFTWITLNTFLHETKTALFSNQFEIKLYLFHTNTNNNSNESVCSVLLLPLNDTVLPLPRSGVHVFVRAIG